MLLYSEIVLSNISNLILLDTIKLYYIIIKYLVILIVNKVLFYKYTKLYINKFINYKKN